MRIAFAPDVRAQYKAEAAPYDNMTHDSHRQCLPSLSAPVHHSTYALHAGKVHITHQALYRYLTYTQAQPCTMYLRNEIPSLLLMLMPCEHHPCRRPWQQLQSTRAH